MSFRQLGISPIIAFCVLVLLSSPIQGQTSADSTNVAPRGADLLATAKQLYQQEGPAKALPEYEKALAVLRHEGDRKNEAITIGLMGNCYKRLGQNAKALEFLQKALAMKREIGDRLEEGKTLSNIGLLYWQTSDYPKAIDYYTQARKVAQEVGDRKLEAAIHNNVGLVYDEMGDARAIGEYNAALELYRGTEPSGATADTIGNIGGWYLLHGRYAEALKSYQEALAIDEKLKLNPSIALDLQNVGLSLTGLGRAPEAITTLDRSIRLARDAGLVKEEADSRKAKASALLQLSKYNDARDEYNKAIDVYEQAGSQGDAKFKQNLVEGLNDLGALEARLGDASSAEHDFHRAIAVAEEIKHPRGVTVALMSLGDLQFRQKRLTEAAAYYSQALSRAAAADDKAGIAVAKIQLSQVNGSLKKFDDALRDAQQARDIARESQAKPLEAEALYALGEASRNSGHFTEALDTFKSGATLAKDMSNPELSWRFDFGSGQSLESLNRNEEALVAYQNAVKTIETVRTELREERFRAGYIEDKYQVYVALVQLLIKLGRVEDAFVAAEKLRARGYLDMLGRGQPPIKNEAQRQQEVTFKNRLRELQKQLEDENSKVAPDKRQQRVDQFSTELNNAETQYERFLDDLQSSEPVYASVSNLKVATSGQVRSTLSADTALIEYVLAEHELVIFVIRSNAVRATTVAISNDDLTSKVETLRDLMLRKDTDEWRRPAAALFQSLIQPVADANWLQGVKRLYIVPHTVLHYLPFAVLPNHNRLLLDDYVISYLPAATALAETSASKEPGGSLLAMAPSNTSLQYTKVESESVSGFFPGRRTVLVGSQATESSFKKLADRYDVIHLATHGFFNKANPLLSGLMLEADATDDGRLEVHEIMNLRLRAKLVTLSACETAVGSGYFSDVPPGDDLVGLTRAFLATGAPSVLASLWEINDRSAVSFMNDFYRQMRHNDKATALTIAQRQMRLQGNYRHPYYWAAFVLAGQMN